MMPILSVRRSGNSLVLVIPSRLARSLHLREGDAVAARIEKISVLQEFFGRLKGVATADELNKLTNEGEDLG